MASYHARQRDPLLDQGTQAVLERRGKELLGAALVVLGLMAGMMLLSYTPEDPGWFASGGEPAQNALGRIGAAIASPLHVIAGYGAWALPVSAVVWGLRLMLHRGEERALSRAIFVPIFVALASVYAASLAPGPGWGHAFGLGGLFGDTVMGTLLGLSPLDGALGLKLLAFLIACATIVLAGFVLGFDMEELAAIWRFLLLGAIMTYAMLLTAASKAGRWTLTAAYDLRDRIRAGRAARSEARAAKADRAARLAEAAALPLRGNARAAVAYAPAEAELFAPEGPAPAPRRVRRAAQEEAEDAWLAAAPPPEPELIEPGPWRTDLAPPPANEDRLRARIADAVKSRLSPAAPAPATPADQGAAGHAGMERDVQAGRLSEPHAAPEAVRKPASYARRPRRPCCAANRRFALLRARPRRPSNPSSAALPPRNPPFRGRLRRGGAPLTAAGPRTRPRHRSTTPGPQTPRRYRMTGPPAAWPPTTHGPPAVRPIRMRAP